MKTKRIGISKLATPKPDHREWGTLTIREVEFLREFVERFKAVCPDVEGVIDPVDQKRITRVEKILNP